MKKHVSIEHSPDYETAVEFNYPTEHLPPEILKVIEELTDQMVHLKLTEAIRRLIQLLEGERNPRITLEALLYSVGINHEDSNGTMTSVANTLKITRQRFHYQTKTVGKRMAKKIKDIQKSSGNPFIS